MKVYQTTRAGVQSGRLHRHIRHDGRRQHVLGSRAHKIGVKVHEVRHEGAGLGMADGYARITHTPGVATATCGPGRDAARDRFRDRRARRVRRSSRSAANRRPPTRNMPSVSTSRSFADACESRFRAASFGRSGRRRRAQGVLSGEAREPPDHALLPDGHPAEELRGRRRPYKPSSDVVHARRRASGCESARTRGRYRRASKKPVIVVGRGAQWAGAGEAVLKLADRIGALIATTLLTKPG